MSTDNLLHFFGGGLYAAAILGLGTYFHAPPVYSAILAVFDPMLLGFARESEQARTKRRAYEAMTGQRFHPSDIRHWSSHKWGEWLAWVAGALLVLGVFSIAR